MKTAFPGFSDQALAFLADLEQNNTREWFHPRKEQFEALLRNPMLELAEALNAALARFAPEYVTDPKKAVMRIYRDTRFSANKTPYKNHVAASFGRQNLKESGGAAFYCSLNHRAVEVAGGLHHPPKEILMAVRSQLAEGAEDFQKLVKNRKLQNRMGALQGGELSRAPKGFDPEHPAINLIKKKSWVFFVQLEPQMATSPRLLHEIESRFEVLAPVLEYLNAPLVTKRATKVKLDRLTGF